MLLDQEHLPSEIIIVEDGSDDLSLEIIEEIAKQSPAPIHVIVNRENRGTIKALNQGLEAARGRFVYFAASDDWVLPGFFSSAIEALESHPQAGLFCGEALLFAGSSAQPQGVRPAVRPIYRTGFVSPSRAKRLLAVSDNWILTGSAIFRRDAVIAAGAFDEELETFADGYLSRKIALTNGFIFASKPVSTWCSYPNSVSRLTVFRVDKAQRILQVVPAKLQSDPVFPKSYSKLFQNRWRFGASRLALAEDPPLWPLVKAMGCVNTLDHFMIGIMSRIPVTRLVRFLALTWLTIRLQPLTLIGLVRTSFARRLERKNNRLHQIAMDIARGSVSPVINHRGNNGR